MHQTNGRRLGSCLLAVGLVVLMAILGARAEAQASVNEDFTQPLPGLTSDQLTTFVAGKAQFEHEFTKKEELGPLFNARACAACHHEPSVGGTGPRYRSNFDFGLQSGGGFDPLLGAGG